MLLLPWRRVHQALRNRFVTGDWAEGAKRSSARPGAGSDDDGEGSEGDDEVFGDFEDMEAGEQLTKGEGQVRRRSHQMAGRDGRAGGHRAGAVVRQIA